MKPCYLCGKRTDDCLFDPPVCRECQRAHELTKEIARAQLAVGTPGGWKTTRTWTVDPETLNDIVIRGFETAQRRAVTSPVHFCGSDCWANGKCVMEPGSDPKAHRCGIKCWVETTSECPAGKWPDPLIIEGIGSD